MSTLRVEGFDWDEANREHIARHQVTPEEVEEVFVEDLHLRRSRSGRYLAYGRTLDGRYLLVVFEERETKIRPITARDMTEKERRLYKDHIKP